ncbi:HD domain-containing protein [Fructobacillus tropaeoli]|uniref:HD superfamily phosphohydrolase (YdhJ) n=1 Tax=Fructobacillus tropaeoli TaxID=709323 RepID=A0ABM9MZJ2_9LACO|nr:HD domain-containing protein [Fructobacillus tropaeoli]GIC70802.1 HD domain-containing protein [Fructobacillus tropaeoli]CAK1229236.1 HD superfamily phosphohydrolase (YdhJ) [Fructobacillus tropaeoli]CAK1251128.1 HD superfamily phosphohydrolase (YdhJ) [Fructobacillus tropaeoli]
MSEKLAHEKVLRDPIHKFIHIQDQLVLDLINTPEFQRLRRVEQLGVTAFVFHGAVHDRFGHSVGAYELARRITDYFNEYYRTKTPGDGLWDPEEQMLTVVAALLHDVGHGAFSHTFEHLFHTNHEQMTQDIITGDTEINRVLQSYSPDFPNKVASVIAKTYENHQVVQLISSQLDVDRMDYLLRDAFYTGATYGEFDIDRIMRTMKPCKTGIAYDIAGMHAVEDYIVSRYQMYLQVYFHPVSRGMEVILEHLLGRVKELLSQGHNTGDLVGPLLAPVFQPDHDLTIDEYLRLDDNLFMTAINGWQDYPDQILADLSSRFLNRRPFKSIQINEQSAPYLAELEQIVKDAGFDPEYYTAQNDAYDLPYDDYKPSEKKPRTQIELVLSDGSHRELSQLSALVASIKGRASLDQRFFFPKEMLNNGPDDLFSQVHQNFRSLIKNDTFIPGEH